MPERVYERKTVKQFNVITTTHRKMKITLQKSVTMYFRRCEANWELMQRYGHMIKTLRLEDLIASPEQHLSDLCRLLELATPRDYVAACSRLLFHKPRQSKSECEWPDSLTSRVSQRITEFPFLKGHQYKTVHGKPRCSAA